MTTGKFTVSQSNVASFPLTNGTNRGSASGPGNRAVSSANGRSAESTISQNSADPTVSQTRWIRGRSSGLMTLCSRQVSNSQHSPAGMNVS